MPLPRAGTTGVRVTATAVCALIATVGCVVAGCAQSVSSPRGPAPVSTQQQCVRAVFDVLRGMTDNPYDSQPFEHFVTRYGTGSVTYDAYLDVFTSYYSLSADDGVKVAETRLRSALAKDCGPAT
jgi:hypothetical protein